MDSENPRVLKFTFFAAVYSIGYDSNSRQNNSNRALKFLSACFGRRSVSSRGIDRAAFFSLMNADEKNRYFQELTLNLQHEGLVVKPETEEGLLPVELDGQRLCLALDTGSVRYWREDTADDHRSAALDKAISITKTTAEYMRQMETAPQLTASGLTGDYRLLADFNDVVLAGHPTRYGVQFATWERVRERTGLNAGNFYGPPGGVDSYTAAKRDFATRSGLIPHVVLFTPEQLTEVYAVLG